MLWTKKTSKYEKEAFIKSFLLFFLSIEIMLSMLFFMYYKNQIYDLKNEIFLKLKNYSYLLKGNDYKVELEAKRGITNFYQLFENKDQLYIYIPIPFVEEDVLKIIYPEEKFRKELNSIRKKTVGMFLLLSILNAVISFVFSVYSIYPLRRSISMINNFVQDIIHDINTPVSSILVNLKILKAKYGDSEEISRMESSVKKLSLIYENLYTLDREVEKNITQVNLKKIMEEEINQLKLNYPNISVKTFLKDVEIKIDEKVIRRIIINLLSNAFKHNTKEGWVNIYLTDNYLQIVNSSKKIKDRSKLFERYYRESQRGLGIGLSIVKKLCEESGLKIKVETAENKFSVFLYF